MPKEIDEDVKRYAYELGEFRRQWILQQEKQEREEELNRARQEAHQEGVDQGFSQGISQGISQGVFQGKVEEAKESCIQLLNKFYLNSDDSFLNNLTLSQYKIVFKALLENQSLDEIKALIKS